MNHNHTPSPPQGMDGWRPLEQIPQLKWKLLGQGPSLMNESDMASLILLIFIRMCEFYPSRDSEDAIVRPLPRAKRLLSEPNTLPHIVQLLLTFDPSLVEKVTKLLNIILQVSVGCVPWSVFLSLPLFLSPPSFSFPHQYSPLPPSSLPHRTTLSCQGCSQLEHSSSFSCTLGPTFYPLQSFSSTHT